MRPPAPSDGEDVSLSETLLLPFHGEMTSYWHEPMWSYKKGWIADGRPSMSPVIEIDIYLIILALRFESVLFLWLEHLPTFSSLFESDCHSPILSLRRKLSFLFLSLLKVQSNLGLAITSSSLTYTTAAKLCFSGFSLFL